MAGKRETAWRRIVIIWPNRSKKTCIIAVAPSLAAVFPLVTQKSIVVNPNATLDWQHYAAAGKPLARYTCVSLDFLPEILLKLRNSWLEKTEPG